MGKKKILNKKRIMTEIGLPIYAFLVLIIMIGIVFLGASLLKEFSIAKVGMIAIATLSVIYTIITKTAAYNAIRNNCFSVSKRTLTAIRFSGGQAKSYDLTFEDGSKVSLINPVSPPTDFLGRLYDPGTELYVASVFHNYGQKDFVFPCDKYDLDPSLKI